MKVKKQKFLSGLFALLIIVSEGTQALAQAEVKDGLAGMLAPPNESINDSGKAELPAARETSTADSAASGGSFGRVLNDDLSVDTSKPDFLKGEVRLDASTSPFLEGSLDHDAYLKGAVKVIPEGTKLDIKLNCNLNSEISQKGQEVWAEVEHDVAAGPYVYLPGKWHMHGLVSEVASPKHGRRDGWVEVEFDKLVGPNGEEWPFPAKLSTKNDEIKAIEKLAIKDSMTISQGAFAGALLSVQLGGIGTAVATHGLSVAVGAGVGAGLGAYACLKNKGQICQVYPGDEMHLTIGEGLTSPGFKISAIPSGKVSIQPPQVLLKVRGWDVVADPLGDKSSRLLRVNMAVNNQSSHEYRVDNFLIVDDKNAEWKPYFASAVKGVHVLSHSNQNHMIEFSIDHPKRHHWLVLMDSQSKGERHELNRVQVN